MAGRKFREIDLGMVSSNSRKHWTLAAICLTGSVIGSAIAVLVLFRNVRQADDRGPLGGVVESEALSDESLLASAEEPNALPAPPVLAVETISEGTVGASSEPLLPPIPITQVEEAEPPTTTDVVASGEPSTSDVPVPPPMLTPLPETIAKSRPVDEIVSGEVAAETDAAQRDEPEVLLKGPVHEAFGEPIAYDAAEPQVVTQEAPPPPMEEGPPDQQPVPPVGQSVAWISGYWQWDGDHRGYIWQSGMWRVTPNGCQWVPGYWNHSPGGWQRVSGFWTPSNQPIQYISQVPPTGDLDPDASTLPHNWDSIWVPGYYPFEGGQYVWRQGYWMNPQPNRIWVPPHYRSTAHGCVFIAGYWDYPLEQRGVIFAPVRFRPGLHREFTPSIVIEAARLAECLFTDPVSLRYCFGDYFDEKRYAVSGIYPWFEHQEHTVHRSYDPLYTHYRSMQLRQDRHWEKRIRADYEYRRDHEQARPMGVYRPNLPVPRGGMKQLITLASPLAKVVVNSRSGLAPMKLQAVSIDRRNQILLNEKKLRDYADSRRRIEETAARVKQNLAGRAKLLADTIERPGQEQQAAGEARRRQAVEGARVQHEAVGRAEEQKKAADLARMDPVDRRKLETANGIKRDTEKRARVDADAKAKLDRAIGAKKQTEATDRTKLGASARATLDAVEETNRRAVELAKQRQDAEQRRHQQQMDVAVTVKPAAQVKREADARATREAEAQREATWAKEAAELKRQQEAKRLKEQQDAAARAKLDAEQRRHQQQMDVAVTVKPAAQVKREADARATREAEAQREATRAKEAAELKRQQEAKRLKEQQDAVARVKVAEAEQAKRQAAERAKQEADARAARELKGQQAAAEQARQREADRARQQQEAAQRAKEQQAAAEQTRQRQVAEQARQQQEAAQRAREQQAAAEQARQRQAADRARQQQAEQARQQREAADRARQQQQNADRARQQKGRGR